MKKKCPEGTILQVVKPLYGIAEAGVHWFATYQAHDRDNLAMETSTYDPCLLITTASNGPDMFGITGLQTDDTLDLGTALFAAKEEEELQKAGFKAKPKQLLTTGATGDFNGCRIKVEDDGSITVTQKSQAEKLAKINTTPNKALEALVSKNEATIRLEG